MENVITVERNSPSPFERVEGLCGVPARSAGVISLVVQTISLAIALLLTTLLFVHVGGYGMLLGADQVVGNVSMVNTTQFPTSVASLLALEELGDEVSLDTSTEMAAGDNNIISAGDNNMAARDNTTTWNETIAVDQEVDLFESTTPEEDLTSPKSNNIWQPSSEPIYHGPFEQLQEIQLKLSNMQVELLPILRASCMLYAGFCIAWLLSLVGLLLSLKLEILDLVYINTFLLAVITTYTFAKVFLVGIMIFYQTELRWNVLLTIGFTVGGLILCFIFQVVGLCFIVIWYRYIDYMNGGDESCVCTSSIVECIKGQRKSRSKPAANDYSIPEATRHSNLPYIDDPPVQQFSNF